MIKMKILDITLPPIVNKIVSKVETNVDKIGMAYGYLYPYKMIADEFYAGDIWKALEEHHMGITKLNFKEAFRRLMAFYKEGNWGQETARTGGMATFIGFLLKELDLEPTVTRGAKMALKFGVTSLVILALMQFVSGLSRSSGYSGNPNAIGTKVGGAFDLGGAY